MPRDYVEPTIPLDATEIADLIKDQLRTLIPGIEFPDGAPHTALIAAFAPQIALGRITIFEIALPLIFAAYGKTLAGVPIRQAIPATGATTWTLTNTLGHLIPAGTQITLRAPDDSRVGFETVEDVTVPAGQSVTPAGGVLIVAVEPGAAGNDLSNDPQLESILADPNTGISWVSSIAVVGTTAAGADGETETEYLDRLAQETELAAPRAITAEDLAAFARRVPEVYRATALDLYDPGPPANSQADGHASIAVHNEAGGTVSAGGKTLVLAEFGTAKRLLNVTIHVIDPAFLTVDVTFSFTVWPGYDPVEVKALAEQAVEDWLSPVNWGRPPGGHVRDWSNETVVRYRDLITVIENVDGLRYTTAVTVEGGTVDINLPAPVGLPQPGVIVGTAV